MKRDQWEHYRRAGELPLIHKRSMCRSVSAVAATALGAWLVIQPPAVNHERAESAVHVTLPPVVVVGKRVSSEPVVTAQSDAIQPVARIVAERLRP
jgi:hypothetical protein